MNIEAKLRLVILNSLRYWANLEPIYAPFATEEDYHRAMAAHNGIPDCCRDAWIISTDEETDRRGQRVKELWPGKGLRYIPCDACIDKGSFVDVHKCKPGCGLDQVVTPGRAKEIWDFHAANP